MPRRKRSDAYVTRYNDGIVQYWEPKPNTALTPDALDHALRVYETRRHYHDSVQWFRDYIKAKGPAKLAKVITRIPDDQHWIPQTATYLARMKLIDVALPPEKEAEFQNVIKALLGKIKDLPIELNPTRKGPTYDFDTMGEFNELLDKSENEDWQKWMMQRQVGPFTLRHIKTRMIATIAEFEELRMIRRRGTIHNDDDLQLLEAYRWLKKPEVREQIEQCQEVVEAVDSILENRKREYKPKKARKPSVQKITQLVKYLPAEPVTNIASLPPEKMLGHTQVWIYDSEKRLLKIFQAKAETTLTFHRQSIDSVEESLCFQKKIRKPEEILPLIVQGTKTAVRKTFEGIRAKAQTTKTRTNEHTVFLRVF